MIPAHSAAAAGASVLGLPFGWGAIFSILGTLVTTLLGGGVLGMWIKTRAENRKVEQDGDAQLRSEMWKDIASLKLSKESMGQRLALAEGRIVTQSVELGQHRFLIKLVTDELDRVSPGNPVAKQARDMLMEMQRQALPLPEEMEGLVKQVAKLCRVDPVEEN